MEDRIWLLYRADLRIRRLSPRTIENYYESLSDAARCLKQPFASCTRADLKMYLGDCTDRLADSTVHMRWVILKIFYNWMVREELIQKNPMDGIGEPQVVDNPPPIRNDDDIRKLLKACSGTSLRDRRDTAIIRLMLEPGGPRRAEIIRLTLEDLDLENELLTILGKGGKTRYIPYGAKSSQALHRYMIARDKHKDSSADALWLGKFGPLTIYALGQILEARCEQADIQKIKPHDLRHYAADKSMAAGISGIDMQTLFGWSSPRMLSVYARSNRTARAIASAREKSVADHL
jgi:integrase/recombinase XerC